LSKEKFYIDYYLATFILLLPISGEIKYEITANSGDCTYDIPMSCSFMAGNFASNIVWSVIFTSCIFTQHDNSVGHRGTPWIALYIAYVYGCGHHSRTQQGRRQGG